MINTTIIDGFWHKFFIFQEKPKDVMMQDVCSFLWVFSKTHLSLYSIVPFIYRSVTLAEACKQVKSCSNLIHLRLAKLFILGPNGIWLTRNHTDSSQNHHSKLWLFCIPFTQEALQVHNLEYSHASAFTSGSCDTSHHWLTNPYWVPLYKV